MKRLHARRLASACILSAAATAALVAPGAASASLGTQCSGPSIGAQGSSLQKLAQQNYWDPQFNTSTDSKACSGKQGSKGTPKITYTSDGSGAGLNSWGAGGKLEGTTSGFGESNAFVATDEPPNATQITNIESFESTPTVNTLETIPVAQESVAIIVDLPTGCTATSTAAPGRLVLNNSTLQGIYAGTVTTWGQLTEGGDAVTGTGCSTDTIQPVVRFDQSGTTHIFKQYLGQINSGTLVTSAGNETWQQLSEGSLNTTWPTAANVIKPAAKGGGELMAKVLATPSSIGYVNIAEARTKFGTPTATDFWVELQKGVKGKGKSEKVLYADPASNGEVATVANANCKSTKYINNEGKPFPPPAVTAPWNNVTTSTTEKTYTLCGLTYDLAFTNYSLLGASSAEATTVNNFLRFVTDKGGQKAITNADYLSLPKEVLNLAAGGAAAID
jgi:ABC-type phosphate transport system substrate-binding protein